MLKSAFFVVFGNQEDKESLSAADVNLLPVELVRSELPAMEKVLSLRGERLVVELVPRAALFPIKMNGY
jgi:hypothetical protein